MYKQNSLFNVFIRQTSIIYFVIHFPEGTLDLTGLFAIPIRLEVCRKCRVTGNT